MNIALLSPNRNAYSETFIQMHKKLLDGRVFFYYSGNLPCALEGGLILNSRRSRMIDIIKGHFRLNRFSLEEKALIKSFKNNKIDVVFAEYGGTGEVIVPVCKELNLPLIVHFHGFDASVRREIKKNNYYKELFAYASSVITVSKKMSSNLEKIGCASSKIIYNPYGPREEFFDVEPKFSKQQFLFIGRFVDKKSPQYLILAINELRNEFPKIKLFMVGEGYLYNSCQNLINYLDLSRNVILLGKQDAEKIRALMSDSLALIQHSVTAIDGDMEGTPLAVLEACAAGLPVISTYHAGIPDVISHGENGYLVKEHDIKKMVSYMKLLLGNPTKAKEIGVKAKKNIKLRFNIKTHISKLNELILKA